MPMENTNTRTIYLDHAATTPLDSRVLEVMLPYMTQSYGNANSVHHLGQKAKVEVENAREKIAHLINAEPSEIIFMINGVKTELVPLGSISPSIIKMTSINS